MEKLFLKNSNLCDHNSPTSQTDGRTDTQTTCDRNTALCTKVHRAVKIGHTVADFESSGNSPSCIDLLNIMDRGLERVSAQLRRTAGWMLSGPWALSSYSFNSFLFTVSSSIGDLKIICLPCTVSSSCIAGSCTKTLLKNFPSIWAASWSVLDKLPLSPVSCATLSFTVLSLRM